MQLGQPFQRTGHSSAGSRTGSMAPIRASGATEGAARADRSNLSTSRPHQLMSARPLQARHRAGHQPQPPAPGNGVAQLAQKNRQRLALEGKAETLARCAPPSGRGEPRGLVCSVRAACIHQAGRNARSARHGTNTSLFVEAFHHAAPKPPGQGSFFPGHHPPMRRCQRPGSGLDRAGAEAGIDDRRPARRLPGAVQRWPAGAPCAVGDGSAGSIPPTAAALSRRPISSGSQAFSARGTPSPSPRGMRPARRACGLNEVTKHALQFGSSLGAITVKLEDGRADS